MEMWDEEQLLEQEALISASITDEQLQSLAGSTNLLSVTFLQMAVDSEFVPLGSLGERLPALEQLKLNGSSIPSIRFLGTSLSKLRVLWICRCGLSGLEGLSALPELQELYVAFNEVSTLTCITEAERLEILDLEANAIAEMEQIEWLQLVPSLQEVTLRGNPVCDLSPTFRADAIALLQHVQLLDDEPTSVLEDAGLASPSFLSCGIHSADEGKDTMLGSSSEPQDLGGMASPSSERGEAGLEEVRKRRQELRMVLDGIKYAEVGRVYDVSADGRSVLSGGLAGGARPSTAWPLLNAWTASRESDSEDGGSRPSSSRRPSTTTTGLHASRPASALFRPSSGFGSRPFTGSGNRPATPRGSAMACDEACGASELTMTADVICGVHKLRAHTLHKQMKELRDDSAARKDLREELMDELRAVKIQQLLAGEQGGASSSDSGDEYNAPYDDPAAHSIDDAVDSTKMWRRECSAHHHEAEVLSVNDADGGTRPSSSEDVTPTQTPMGSQLLNINVNVKNTMTSRYVDQLSGNAPKPTTGTSQKRSLIHSRISGGRANAPVVLRHLRMPDEPHLAEAAAEILQLS